ncbi:MAG: type II secretion system F family protein [Candidatus Sulfotelmatobacter sp.]|jgi:type IV pilus assembly protein PilC|nr:MAG: secretion system protein [Acidobacteria bacterium 13_1_20CM_4_56_7]PYQ38694.1 MAG: type II secretion system F family protein [Acidobacteriota bacterium]
MAEFVVKVADDRGRVHQQIEQGYSETEVRDRFSQQGYLVYWVKPQGMLAGGVSMRRRRKLKQATFLVFNQQFLTLIRAGLPILNSLELLIKRQKDATLKQILENVRDRVKGGELLSDSFAAQGIVPKIYTTTLMAGEKSGNMDEVLTRYINFQRLAMTFRKKLFVSLIYPTLLVTVVMIMVTFLFTYVVPKFADLFSSLDAKLPAITVFMLGVGVNAQKYAPFVVVGLIVLGFVLWRWKDTDGGADRIDRAILSLPLLGEIRLKHQVASFSRMLATLLQGGLPLVPAMETAGTSMTSRRILKGIMRAGTRVREGQGLAPSLEEQEIFPGLAVEMIEVGESTGALPQMLNSVAEFYEEDVQTALGATMALIEPIILMVMAVFVGGVLISLYLPIFTLGVH